MEKILQDLLPSSRTSTLIVLLDDNHELIIDESIYQDSNTFDVELLDNMSKYELIINENSKPSY